MRRYPVLLLLAAPILDFVLLVIIAQHIGGWPVIAFVLASALVGGRLARREGRRVRHDLETARGTGQVPREGLLSAALLALAGALLVVPGLVSTLCGLALLVPATRRLLSRIARDWFERRLGVIAVPDRSAFDPSGELPASRRASSDTAGKPRIIDIDEQGRPVR